MEFGVLVGSHSGEPGHNRYPSLEFVRRWSDFSQAHEIACAVHLCGRFSRAVLNGTATEEVLALCAGFGRVQVNARHYDDERIATFADRVSCERVILQQRTQRDATAVVPHPKVEYLFDLSGGRGRASFEEWPAPSTLQGRHGYAGGLNPHNIDQAVAFVERYPDSRIWLDMESGVRSDDWFDLGKVEAVCGVVFGRI